MIDLLLKTSWLVPCYGLFGGLATLPWSTRAITRTGPRPAAYLNLMMTCLGFLHGAFAFRSLWGQPAQSLTVPWLNVGELHLSLILELSPVSLGALELVSGLSIIAQVFALGYMEKDWALARFFGFMGVFEAAIGGLALSDSLLLSYGLLELLTLSTYLLVGFWYAQPLAVTAARDAFLTKRVGDILLLMGMVALSNLAGSLDFTDLARWAPTAHLPMWQATLLGLALLAGPVGKCAQFPLHLWLDEAMEGPNPASIMRNSVVVACGAYVLVKLEPVLSMSPVVQGVAIALGTMTAIGASLVAIAQVDLKRALSHTTSAYLGLVFVAVGLHQSDVALLLLLTHALSKSTMFLGVGGVIATTTCQDVRELGGLWSRMPATTTAFLVGAAGTVGLLPLGMFWAMYRWMVEPTVPRWTLLLLLAVNFLTALNFTRVFALVFGGVPQPKTRRAPEVPWPMAVPMVSMTVVTLLVPLMLERWQLLLSRVTTVTEGVLMLDVPLMVALVVSGAAGVALGAWCYLRRGAVRPVRLPIAAVQDLLSYDFYIDRIYRLTVAAGVGAIAQITAWIDRYVVDGLVNAVGVAAIFGGEGLKYSTTGQLQAYVLVFLLGVSGFVAIATLSRGVMPF